MIDHERELLKWVAGELLGKSFFANSKKHVLLGWISGDPEVVDLESWHGIGLVVEEMEKRGWYFGSFNRCILKDNKGGRHLAWSANFYREGEFEGHNWMPGSQAWFAVYAASRNAMTND